jgi:hypothetical protein
MTLNLLLSDYRNAAIAYGVADENFNSTIANQEHEKLMKIYSQLKHIGGNSFEKLKQYFRR